MNKELTGPEFLKRLADGTLRSPLVREGFARPVEGRHESFLFSTGTSCDGWTEIPCEVVRKVEFLGEHSCRDHSHPVIRIHFREPSADERYATVLSDLLPASNPEPGISSVTGLPIRTFIGVSPFIGEWFARLIADAAFYAVGSGGGGGGSSPADIAERKDCLALRQRCQGRHESMRAFEDRGVLINVPPNLHRSRPGLSCPPRVEELRRNGRSVTMAFGRPFSTSTSGAHFNGYSVSRPEWRDQGAYWGQIR